MRLQKKIQSYLANLKGFGNPPQSATFEPEEIKGDKPQMIIDANYPSKKQSTEQCQAMRGE